MTMSSNNRSDTPGPLSKLASLSAVVVLSVIWCFVFLLIFIICYLLKTQQHEVTSADVSLNEVSEKTRKREKHKTYKERVNSVYYEWLRDHTPQRKPNNSEMYEMVDMS